MSLPTLFVVFVGAVAVEFSRGTFRTMLLYEPRRTRLLAGKMAGLLLFAAVVLAAAEVITWVAARLFAPSQDVATGEWFSAAALGDGLTDYASVLYWVTGYALLGMMVAVLVRSVPLALGSGSHGPARSSTSSRTPGALPSDLPGPPGGVRGRRHLRGQRLRAFFTVTAYVLIATTIAATSFARRDVTS